MSLNTTEHLLRDMERLREHLGVDRWLLFGGSWGSTLILAYAEHHPERVSQIIVPALTMSRRSEIDWLYRGWDGSSPRNGTGSVPASPRPTTTAIWSRRTRA
jgi:pimeloyl-ACP methyl ester carboxylesterase